MKCARARKDRRSTTRSSVLPCTHASMRACEHASMRAHGRPVFALACSTSTPPARMRAYTPQRAPQSTAALSWARELHPMCAVRVPAHAHTRTRTYSHVCIIACGLRVYMSGQKGLCARACACECTCACERVSECVCVCVCMHTHTYTHSLTHPLTHTHTTTHAHTCIYTHIHMHMHIHLHVHTYIRTQRSGR